MVTAYNRDINETNKVSLLFPPENCRPSPEKSFPPELFSRMFLRIMTRHCAISVATAADWDTKFVLDDYCIREIQFWKNNLYRLNTNNIDLAPISSNYVIYSDASATGCGAHIQLFRERLSEKVHATIPKGIVGGFEFTVLQRNLKELARKAMKMCLRVLTKSN